MLPKFAMTWPGELEEFRHIDMSRGRQFPADPQTCSAWPIRFPDPAAICRRRRAGYSPRTKVPPSNGLSVDGREMLYVLNFYLPRFLDLSFREKLTTIAHELLHIGPKFDGDLRRFAGRCYAHSHSHAEFDAQAEQLGQRWLALQPAPAPLTHSSDSISTICKPCMAASTAGGSLPRSSCHVK